MKLGNLALRFVTVVPEMFCTVEPRSGEPTPKPGGNAADASVTVGLPSVLAATTTFRSVAAMVNFTPVGG